MVIPVIPFWDGKLPTFLIASEPLGQNQHQIWFEKNKQLVTEVEPPNKSLAHQSIVESSIGVMPIPLFGYPLFVGIKLPSGKCLIWLLNMQEMLASLKLR